MRAKAKMQFKNLTTKIKYNKNKKQQSKIKQKHVQQCV